MRSAVVPRVVRVSVRCRGVARVSQHDLHLWLRSLPTHGPGCSHRASSGDMASKADRKSNYASSKNDGADSIESLSNKLKADLRKHIQSLVRRDLCDSLADTPQARLLAERARAPPPRDFAPSSRVRPAGRWRCGGARPCAQCSLPSGWK